jgi:hypothetical protein
MRRYPIHSALVSGGESLRQLDWRFDEMERNLVRLRAENAWAMDQLNRNIRARLDAYLAIAVSFGFVALLLVLR